MHTNRREVSWLIIIMICAKIFFTDIMIFVHSSGTAAHLQALWCIIIEWILFIVTYHFFKKCRGRDIFECISISFGKTGLTFLGFIIFLLEISNLGTILKIYSETLSSLTLTTSPIWYISGFIILCMIFSVYSHPRGLLGICSGLGIFIIALFLAIVMLDFSHYDVTNLFPVSGNGAYSIFTGIKGVTIFNDLFFIYYLSGTSDDKYSVKKSGITILSVTSVITIISVLSYTFAVPYPISTRFYMPIFQISSDITTDVVIQRAEALFLVMWILTIFIYMGAHFYFLTVTYQKAFGASDSKAIAPVSIVIIIGISSLWQNINGASPVLSTIKDISAITYNAILLFTFIICALKRKREDKIE